MEQVTDPNDMLRSLERSMVEGAEDATLASIQGMLAKQGDSKKNSTSSTEKISPEMKVEDSLPKEEELKRMWSESRRK